MAQSTSDLGSEPVVASGLQVSLRGLIVLVLAAGLAAGVAECSGGLGHTVNQDGCWSWRVDGRKQSGARGENRRFGARDRRGLIARSSGPKLDWAFWWLEHGTC